MHASRCAHNVKPKQNQTKPNKDAHTPHITPSYRFPLDEFTSALRDALRTPRDAAWPICAYVPWDVDVLYDAPTLHTTRRSVLPVVPLLVPRLCAADLAALANTCVALQRAVRAAWVLCAPPAVVAALRSRDSHGCRPWLMLVLHQPRIAPAAHLALLRPGDDAAGAAAAATAPCWWAVVELPDHQRALVQCTDGVWTACLSVRRWGAKTCADVRLGDAASLAADASTVTTPTATLRVVEAFACAQPRKHAHGLGTSGASAAAAPPPRPRTLFKRHSSKGAPEGNSRAV